MTTHLKSTKRSNQLSQLKEDFVQFIWRMQLFEKNDLRTTDGDLVSIIYPGELNHNAGPDFSNAKIKIQNKLWVGSVEIHTFSSHWTHHNHDGNPAYENVILHVVLNDDKSIHYGTGEKIPCIEIASRLQDELIEKYHAIMFNANWIPCASKISAVPHAKVNFFLERLIMERLERKAKTVLSRLMISQNNWDAICYEEIARYLGMKVNGESFYRLVNNTPLDILLKHRNNLFQLEAILFGQAGFLRKPKDDYEKALSKEYQFLAKKYNLTPMLMVEWKFARMRPSSFPTVRIAQLAAIITKSGRLFSFIKENPSSQELKKILSIKASSYWQTHYRFGSETKKNDKKLGKATIDILIINAIVPLVYAYGIKTNNEHYLEHAISLLNSIKAESNKFIKAWKTLNIVPNNASQSQALLRLKQNYCDQYKCLNCTIGAHIMNS